MNKAQSNKAHLPSNLINEIKDNILKMLKTNKSLKKVKIQIKSTITFHHWIVYYDKFL
jgi:hypothetical protein